MAYKKKEIFEQAKAAILQHKVIFIEELVAYLPCDKTTFYRFFPTACNEYNTLRGLIDKNKITIKKGLQHKLYNSNSPTAHLALYRLIGTDEERRLLNQQYMELTGKDGAALNPRVEVEIIDKREDVINENTDH